MIVVDENEIFVILQQSSSPLIKFIDVDGRYHCIENKAARSVTVSDKWQKDGPNNIREMLADMKAQRAIFLKSLDPTIIVVHMDVILAKFEAFVRYYEEEQYNIAGPDYVTDQSMFFTQTHRDVLQALRTFSKSQMALLFMS